MQGNTMPNSDSTTRHESRAPDDQPIDFDLLVCCVFPDELERVLAKVPADHRQIAFHLLEHQWLAGFVPTDWPRILEISQSGSTPAVVKTLETLFVLVYVNRDPVIGWRNEWLEAKRAIWGGQA